MNRTYASADAALGVSRRLFVSGLGACSVMAGSVVVGVPAENEDPSRKPGPTSAPEKIETNIDAFMKASRARECVDTPTTSSTSTSTSSAASTATSASSSPRA